MPNDDAQIEAIARILPALFQALDALAYVARRLHPTILGRLTREAGQVEAKFRDAMATFRDVDWPETYTPLKQPIDTACVAVCDAFDGLKAALDDPDGLMLAYRALRHVPRAAEALYPLAAHIQPISQFFLEEDRRDDEDLLHSLAAGNRVHEQVGVMHASNEKHERGGFSLYVPESYRPDTAYPMIVALHGGSGHGRAFLWTWLRQARSRGAIVISPTSVERTWSLMRPEMDSDNIRTILDHVGAEWKLDPDRMLLTGMSDGGTFAYLAGLAQDAPFTHLAPISASFQPLLLEFIDRDRLAGMPIYLTHGALDWMFNIDIARNADTALSAAGADVTFREIADLSHTYPTEENARILDWFLADG